MLLDVELLLLLGFLPTPGPPVEYPLFEVLDVEGLSRSSSVLTVSFSLKTLYQKVIEDDSNYTEAQKRATEMLDLYWKQQDALVEQGEYQTAIENTASAMSFM